MSSSWVSMSPPASSHNPKTLMNNSMPPPPPPIQPEIITYRDNVRMERSTVTIRDLDNMTQTQRQARAIPVLMVNLMMARWQEQESTAPAAWRTTHWHMRWAGCWQVEQAGLNTCGINGWMEAGESERREGHLLKAIFSLDVIIRPQRFKKKKT